MVDDDEALRDAIRRALRLEGYDVELAGNGARALARLAGMSADLVVLDVLMQVLDGVSVCRRLRASRDRAPTLARRDPGQIRTQFLTESVLLSALGGGTGVLLGSAVTAVYASLQGWPTVVPIWVMSGAVTTTVVIGALAGLYPAIRAARLALTEALATI